MTAPSAIDAAIRIARASGSPMERAASGLDPVRYGIFCATYASMRVIDDFVDDDFLALPADARARDRAGALATVERWQVHASAALADGAAPPPDDRFVETHQALAAVHRQARIDPDPWRRLAGAMALDVGEAPMPDWDAFLAYAEGATAAPAAVFIEILALEPKPDGRLASRLAGDAVDRIRNSAVLLYLVHIMRDLAEDAAKGAMLLTLPDTLFQNLGTDATAFASDPTPALVHAARKEVAGFAEQFLAPAWLELAALDEALAPGDAAVLRGLCEPYIERYETFAASL